MKRDAQHEEIEKRDRAATLLKELRLALGNMIRAINADGRTVADPRITEAGAMKRMHEAAARLESAAHQLAKATK